MSNSQGLYDDQGNPIRPRLLTSQWPNDTTRKVVKDIFRVPKPKDDVYMPESPPRFYQFHRIIMFAETMTDAVRTTRMWLTDDHAFSNITRFNIPTKYVDFEGIVQHFWNYWRTPECDMRPVFRCEFDISSDHISQRWPYGTFPSRQYTMYIISDQPETLEVGLAFIPLRFCILREKIILPAASSVEHWQNAKELELGAIVKINVGVRLYVTGDSRLFYWHERKDCQ